MFTIIRSDNEATFSVSGIDLTVRAKFNERQRVTGQGMPYDRAKWTVKMTYQGRAASFKYYVGSGNRGYDEYIDFADFAESVASDASAVYDCDDYRAFASEYGYTDMAAARRDFNACTDCVRKLNRVFSLRRGEFIAKADCREFCASESVA